MSQSHWMRWAIREAMNEKWRFSYTCSELSFISFEFRYDYKLESFVWLVVKSLYRISISKTIRIRCLSGRSKKLLFSKKKKNFSTHSFFSIRKFWFFPPFIFDQSPDCCDQWIRIESILVYSDSHSQLFRHSRISWLITEKSYWDQRLSGDNCLLNFIFLLFFMNQTRFSLILKNSY